MQPFDRGPRAAKFPYSRHSLIETEADCLEVTRDQTQQWDEAFQLPLRTYPMQAYLSVEQQ
jgi:hypothetical protein